MFVNESEDEHKTRTQHMLMYLPNAALILGVVGYRCRHDISPS